MMSSLGKGYWKQLKTMYIIAKILHTIQKIYYKFKMLWKKRFYLGNDHLTWRGWGGYGFYLKQIFWFPMLLKKIYTDFGGGKKK
jgi:hypothetical protein